MDLTKIFNGYYSSEGVPFYFLTKSVSFPEDDNLDIYLYTYNSEDIPWTVLSYNLYETIEYWWVLSTLNKTNKFYAPANTTIKYIDKTYLQEMLAKL